MFEKWYEPSRKVAAVKIIAIALVTFVLHPPEGTVLGLTLGGCLTVPTAASRWILQLLPYAFPLMIVVDSSAVAVCLPIAGQFWRELSTFRA